MSLRKVAKTRDCLHEEAKGTQEIDIILEKRFAGREKTIVASKKQNLQPTADVKANEGAVLGTLRSWMPISDLGSVIREPDTPIHSPFQDKATGAFLH